jgi:aminodeoxychorismate lyase
MQVFLNGQIVPEERAVVSVFDRAFLYGDGLFETILVFHSKPFRWEQHIERLHRGTDFLNIRLPASADALRNSLGKLIEENQMPDSLLRITVSRGVGIRGYSPKGANQPTLVMSLHAAPAFGPQKAPEWRLTTSSFRLAANDPISQYKTCNKLAQVLARAQAEDAGADEALLLNSDGAAVEGSSSNLFWVERGVLCTPPLPSGILPGVTRAVVLELCQAVGCATQEATVLPEQLRQADGVFLSLSSFGIAECISLDGLPLRRSPFINKLRLAYWDLVRKETG